MSPPEGATTPERLQQDAQALGVPLDDAACRRLRDFLALLLRWNRSYNLTAIRDEAGAFTLHLLDCLSVLPPLDRHAGGRDLKLLDVGSGGGLPGAVIAIVRPGWQVACVDAVAKKAGFVRQAALELGLGNLQAHHARVEALAPAAADVVTARAFASLADFTARTHRHLAPGRGVWLAMKGRRPDDEIAALPPDVAVFHVERLSVPGLAAERCAVWMRPNPGAGAA